MAQLGKLLGVGLLIIGALQALGSLALGLPITDPVAVLLRTTFGIGALLRRPRECLDLEHCS